MLKSPSMFEIMYYYNPIVTFEYSLTKICSLIIRKGSTSLALLLVLTRILVVFTKKKYYESYYIDLD